MSRPVPSAARSTGGSRRVSGCASRAHVGASLLRITPVPSPSSATTAPPSRARGSPPRAAGVSAAIRPTTRTYVAIPDSEEDQARRARPPRRGVAGVHGERGHPQRDQADRDRPDADRDAVPEQPDGRADPDGAHPRHPVVRRVGGGRDERGDRGHHDHQPRQQGALQGGEHAGDPPRRAVERAAEIDGQRQVTGTSPGRPRGAAAGGGVGAQAHAPMVGRPPRAVRQARPASRSRRDPVPSRRPQPARRPRGLRTAGPGPARRSRTASCPRAPRRPRGPPSWPGRCPTSRRRSHRRGPWCGPPAR